MPFTFSHPALVLPLTKINKKYISATALVAGSVSPDFEYFINMRLMQVHGHSFWGMFYYDLPIAIALCFLFHYTVRDALIKYSPFPVKDELKQYYGFNWKERFKTSWFVIAISALIGIGSHILWDDFTHANRFFVDLIPYLQRPVHFAGKTYLMCEIFWILSSLFGAAIVIICAYVPPLNKERKQKLLNSSIYWGLVVIICMITLVLRGVHGTNTFVATSIAGGLIGMMLAPVFMKWLKIEREIFHKEQN